MKNRGIRWASATGVALGALVFSACDVRETLLSPQQPGTILPGDIAGAGAAGAEALRVGALGRLQQITSGGGGANQSSTAMLADALSDVWKSGDTFQQHNETDQRTVSTNNSVLSQAYITHTQSRGFYRDAIDALKEFVPETPAKQGEMFFAMGYAETTLAEYFCSGIPLGETANGEWTYTQPFTTEEVFARAITHFDTALTLSAGTDAFSASIRHASAVAKARALVNMGRWADAATAVAAVPTSFSYNVTFSQPTNSNNVWGLAGQVSSRARFVVGDSFDTQGIIPNALPFSSANDPRVPTTGSPTSTTTKSIDGVTPLVAQQIWTDRAHPIPVVSGLDARLIEAEARLQANDIAGVMTILNALRAAPPSLGPFTPAAMPALATPATKDAATTVFFREKAFWQFGRGTRLGDLRRLVRQYNRPATAVFPTGRFHKSGGAPYGTDVNLPVTDNEKANPNFTGCLDRSA